MTQNVVRALTRWPIPVLLFLACRGSTERDRVDFERMRRQQRYELYGQSTVFPNGQMMQSPPPGTVSRESIADTGVVGTGVRSGREVTMIPIAMTPERIAAGAQKYAVYCGVCHGAAGFGGSIVAENMGRPRPPSLRTTVILTRPVGRLFAVITHGQGRMPSTAWQLTTEERWAIVGYLEQWQRMPPHGAIARADSLHAREIMRIDSAMMTTTRDRH